MGATQSAIQGGTTDATHSYAVGVCIGGKGIGNTASGCYATCSGALLAPNLVVTARHCVDKISSEQVDCARTTFGSLMFAENRFWITTSSDMHQSTQGWHQVSKVVTPTPTSVCGNDLALLVLAENIAASEATPITPAVEHPMTDHARYSTTNTAIGYGITSPDGSDGGTRRIKQNIDIQCIPGDSDPRMDCGAALGQVMTAAEFVSGDGTCQGDSGSSAYEQLSFNAGAPVSLGVLSRGGTSTDGQRCVDAIYTRLDAWKDLIISTALTAAKQGNYTAPSWTAPQPADAGTKSDAAARDASARDATAGDSSSSSPKTLGSACASDNECASNVCRSASSDAPICTRSCSIDACPDGYACTEGYCAPAASGSTTTTTGCAMSGAPRSPTQNSVPLRALGAVAGLLGLAAARRRRTSVARTNA